MSFTENDRKLRSKIGKTFQDGNFHDVPPFSGTIAGALKVDFGSAPSSVKHVARLTRANERAVRNWFDGRNGPSGENLVSLIKHSDAVFDAVLSLSQRGRLPSGIVLIRLRQHLVAAVAEIDAAAQEGE